MAVLTRWAPVREFSGLQDRLNRMNRLFRESFTSESPEEALTTTSFAPPVDIHGERKFEKDEKEENYRRIERQYGSFTRSFTLPNSVDPTLVSAHYDKGVLKVNLAKKAEAKPKQIKVNVGSEKALEGKVHSKAA